MAELAPQNKRTKPKAEVDPATLDPKERPDHDNTSMTGEKNIEGLQGRDGNEDKTDTGGDKAPFVP